MIPWWASRTTRLVHDPRFDSDEPTLMAARLGVPRQQPLPPPVPIGGGVEDSASWSPGSDRRRRPR